jgi:hypothetical protein
VPVHVVVLTPNGIEENVIFDSEREKKTSHIITIIVFIQSRSVLVVYVNYKIFTKFSVCCVVRCLMARPRRNMSNINIKNINWF